jgi:signal transduction histidine kinase
VTNLLYLIAFDPGLTEEGKAYVHDAESELRRVSEITTHMLRFYRQSTHATEVDLIEVLESVLVLFGGRLTRAGIEVVKQYSPAPPLNGYAGELRQIFANLVGNALDALHSGGRLILRVREGQHARGGHKGLRIIVADTGCGMSPATRDRVFEPFFTTKGITGTGLGWWVSRELIGKHRGSVRIRSRQGDSKSGTVFSLFFPFAPAPEAAPVASIQRVN